MRFIYVGFVLVIFSVTFFLLANRSLGPTEQEQILLNEINRLKQQIKSYDEADTIPEASCNSECLKAQFRNQLKLSHDIPTQGTSQI